jgi:hypothetical protein
MSNSDGDNNSVSDYLSDAASVSSSVDEEAKRRQKHPENYDKSNKLNLGKFHRYGIAKNKKRTVTSKKKIRDLERLLAKTEGKMPEEVRAAKLKELKELKKGEKSKKEAEKFESRYKKIKFFEKKKIIRRLEKLDKKIKETNSSGTSIEEMEEERTKYRNYLTYVNNFPDTAKYISLFPVEDTDKSKEKREQMMAKILKIAEVKNKIREKELLEMDGDHKMEADSDSDHETKVT